MFGCNKCGKMFKTKTKLKAHQLRMRPCKIPEYYCVLCKKGLGSYRTMWEHRQRCIERPGTSFREQERLCRIKKRVNKFFSTLSSDFPVMLEELEKLFPPNVESEESLKGSVPYDEDHTEVSCEKVPNQREEN